MKTKLNLKAMMYFSGIILLLNCIYEYLYMNQLLEINKLNKIIEKMAEVRFEYLSKHMRSDLLLIFENGSDQEKSFKLPNKNRDKYLVTYMNNNIFKVEYFNDDTSLLKYLESFDKLNTLYCFTSESFIFFIRNLMKNGFKAFLNSKIISINFIPEIFKLQCDVVESYKKMEKNFFKCKIVKNSKIFVKKCIFKSFTTYYFIFSEIQSSKPFDQKYDFIETIPKNPNDIKNDNDYNYTLNIYNQIEKILQNKIKSVNFGTKKMDWFSEIIELILDLLVKENIFKNKVSIAEFPEIVTKLFPTAINEYETGTFYFDDKVIVGLDFSLILESSDIIHLFNEDNVNAILRNTAVIYFTKMVTVYH
ncbi:hypothetical protein CWI36_1877p0010 [Hamiltosporidium magnivora]|uniref:Uncharacterized protein n=1 Tax=Hamiltosporidium magnivora TaxID=148818 RepID=A0A4Q9KXN0_9MICR|nr:hypothetical protein CWI36_1877p0010 [Hamiltosporidium magnivora]